MAMQNMCKHATYCTDKISSSYLFVFCVRLKTFQPPLVAKPGIAVELGGFLRHIASFFLVVCLIAVALRTQCNVNAAFRGFT